MKGKGSIKKFVVLVSLLAVFSVFAFGCGSADDATQTGEEVNADGDYSKFAGDWYVDGSLENGHLSISADGHVESYSYDGMVNFEGEMRCEEYENPDGSIGYIYNIYDGEFFVMAENRLGTEQMLISAYEIVFVEKDGRFYVFG